jgi:hypothetical protein
VKLFVGAQPRPRTKWSLTLSQDAFTGPEAPI